MARPGPWQSRPQRRLLRGRILLVPLSLLLGAPGCDPEPRPERRAVGSAMEDPTAQFEPRPIATPTSSPFPTKQPNPSPTHLETSTAPQPKTVPTDPVLEAGDEPTTFLLILDDGPDPIPALGEAAHPLEDVTLQDLVSEREKLRRELRKLDQQAVDMAQLPLPPPPPAETPKAGTGFAGTIRDLNLTGVPQADAQTVMGRYGMKMVLSTAPAGVTQSYLSGATGQDGQRFSARSLGRNQPTHALVITPTTIEQMARLERQELQKRGLDPSRTLVQRIVFGVVGSGNTADLGVVLFEAVPVTQPAR